MFIEINLMPSDMRVVKKEPQEIKVHLIINAIMVGTFILFVAIGSFVLSRKNILHYMELRWKKLEPQKKEVDALKAQIAERKARYTTIDQLIKDRFLWSKKLNIISDVLVDGVWLNSVTYQQQFVSSQEKGAMPKLTRNLMISGTAIAQQGGEMSNVGRFMKNLKDNPDFFTDFKGVEMSSMQRRSIVDVEVMDFSLLFQFKEENAI